MIGLSALLFILAKMLGGVIHGNTIIAVSPALSSGRGLAARGMRVSMHMVSLNAGFTLPSIGLGFARMRTHAPEEFVSLLIRLRSFGPCMLPRVQLCLLPGHFRLVLLHLRWDPCAPLHWVLHLS